MPFSRSCFRLPSFCLRSFVTAFWVSGGLGLLLPTGGGATTSVVVADGDVAALVAAMEVARDGDTIDLAPNGFYRVEEVHNSRNGANGLPVVAHQIQLRGNGATLARAEDAPPFRLLYFRDVGSGAEVSDLTIRNGWVEDADGGGIYHEHSHPTLSNLVMEGNRAPGGAGGAIYNRRSSPVVTAGLFIGNEAESGGAMANADGSNPIVENSQFLFNEASLGGAMLNDSSGPTISHCLFKENKAWESRKGDGRGGAMANINQSTTTIRQSRFEGNEVYWGWGGGVYNAESRIVIRNSEFVKNQAEPMGGGVFSRDAVVTVVDSLWDNNWAMRHGGGMANVRSEVSVDQSIFRRNSVNDSGAGIFNSDSQVAVADSWFENNSGEEGGGMANVRTDAILSQCVFTGNVGDEGGGLFNWESRPILTDCLFRSNFAYWEGGGMVNFASDPLLINVAFEENATYGRGGGMANLGPSAAHIVGSFFGANVAGAGGGIYGQQESWATVGTTIFCQNDPSPVDGPWADLGSNWMSDTCRLTYGNWVGQHFGSEEWEDEAVTGPRADPSGEGTPNLVKYALGLPLGAARPQPWGSPEVREVLGEEYLTLTFSHPAHVVDLDYVIQLSTDLRDWSEQAVLVASRRTGRMTTRTYRDPRPLAATERRFMRLAVRLEE